MALTNEQWQQIAEYLLELKAQPGMSGRPPQDFQSVLNDILWILNTVKGATVNANKMVHPVIGNSQ